MRKILDPKNLPLFAAFIQGGLFSIAGNQYFPILGWLVGFGVGIVVNYTIALAASRISDIAKNRKGLSYVALVGLLSLSPVIICSTLGWSLANFSWAIACDVSIILGGSITGKSLLPAQAGDKPVKKKTKPVKAEPEPAQAEVKPAFPCSCGKVFGSQPALNAHQRKHKPAEIFEAIANKKG